MYQSDLLRLIDPRHKVQKILGVSVRLLQILLEKVKNQVAVQLLFSRKEQGLSLIHQLADEVRTDREKNAGIVRGEFLRMQRVSVHQAAASGGIEISLALHDLIHAALQHIGEFKAVVLMLAFNAAALDSGGRGNEELRLRRKE